MRFIDTNLLIRFFTKDDKEKANKVLALFKRVEKNEEIITMSPLVIFETIFTLEKSYGIPGQEIKNLLLPILALKGLHLANREIYEHALDFYIEKNISFADAYNAACVIKEGIKEIYSYDEDFDKIEGIKRVVP
ncbi:pilus assembly protein [Candidatus Desantisbacteria bacterium CG1_02_38_46]|uniref:Pilus assembly protein n=3 Tax=unclassified Candidatus Desantisiibacteriota TaxID=3106372 RepID=A0A2H9PC94_9BACT|nr:MAG: pilus assembly protein [Candidatus Desantisbacteria bacterium CG1_02_38_46]PIU50858.1 MAG: pilus assembly protein [Candidatus Desantisbacteria bacterium CG07_land_8_20_14_0_80_39_15]PIZ16770.1 MAG: pilus assembly protein [Candidatus Desantisbacteria bacterium CG_4_10_14_0_8_um_filter_39_17]